MNRRDFMSQMGMGILTGAVSGPLKAAAKVVEITSASCESRTELIMLIWCAHAMNTVPWKEDNTSQKDFTPEIVRDWIRTCEELGVTTIFWRGSYVGKATYHSNVLPMMKPLEPGYFEKRDKTGWEETRKGFNRIAEAIKGFDTLDVAIDEAKKRKIKLYGDIGLFDMYFPGLENDFFEENPQYWLLGRDQKTIHHGVPCYAEKAAQDYRLAEIKELINRGVDGISYYLQTHVDNGDHAPNSLGFNPPVVVAYKKRYGVDILNEEFEPAKLHQLNGEIFTEFLRRIRQTIGPDRKFVPSIMVDGYGGYGGRGASQLGKRCIAGGPVLDTPAFRFNLEWSRWINEGIADDLMVYAPIPNAVLEIQQAVKSKLKKGRAFLWRKTSRSEYYDDYQKEITAIQNGALDGYVIYEFNQYIYPDSPNRKLLK